MADDKFSLYQTQVQTNVSFASFMTAVVVFFAGLLLSSFHNYDLSIKVPIAYLIISIFGFINAAFIYTSAAEEVSFKREEAIKRHLHLGDVLSEYLGVYLLVISIPMVVSAITNDAFLRTVAMISSLAGLAFYQFSQASLIERHFKQNHKILSILALILGFLLFLTQIYSYYFVFTASVFILFMLLITCIALKQVKTGRE